MRNQAAIRMAERVDGRARPTRPFAAALGAAALGVVILFAAGCEMTYGPDELGTAEAALGGGASNACDGLWEAWSNVCPDRPSCPRIEWQLERHGCLTEPEPVCPCTPESWWLNLGYNGLYCGSTEYGRLSVCTATGEEICVANYGTTAAVAVDPALCDACRDEFPVDALLVNPAPGQDDVVHVEQCEDWMGPAISVDPNP